MLGFCPDCSLRAGEHPIKIDEKAKKVKIKDVQFFDFILLGY